MKNQQQFKKIRLLSLLLVSVTTFAYAQLWTQQTPTFLRGNDVLGLANFGYSVSLSADGNTALIGAKGLKVGENDFQGAAYIYTRTNGVWTQKQKLLAKGAYKNDEFGTSVSLSADGKTALVGLIEHVNRGGGSVAIFVNRDTSWVQTAELRAFNASLYADFGERVCLSADGNTAIIAAFNKNYLGGSSGSYPAQGQCYFYSRTTDSVWVLKQLLVPSNTTGSERFGTSLSLSNDATTLFIGAPGYQIGVNGNGFDQGKVFVFKRLNNNWTESAILAAADGSEGDNFGKDISLSADGNTALISAYYKKIGTNVRQGKAYIFENSTNGWSEKYSLVAPDGAANDNFGQSVALSSDGYTALIGAASKNVGATNQGKAYVFARLSNSWVMQSGLTASDGFFQDYFGYSVSLSANGNTAMISSYFKDGGTGGVYSFIRNPNATIENTLKNQIEIYPTLASDIVTVKIAKTGSPLFVEIVNIYGQVVYRQKIEQTSTIDVRNLLRGVYFVSVHYDRGGSSIQKVIKE